MSAQGASYLSLIAAAESKRVIALFTLDVKMLLEAQRSIRSIKRAYHAGKI